MKIGLVLDDTLDTPDGVQQYVLAVGAWLSAQGHEVHYLVGATTRTDIEHVHSLSRNLKVKFNGNRMSIPLPVPRRRLRQFLAAHRFDVIHVQVPYSPLLAGRLLSAVPAETAVVGTFHILPYSRSVRSANRLLAIWNRRSGRRFDTLMAVSEPARIFAEKTYGYRGMQIVPNPFALQTFLVPASKKRGLHIVFMGRLVERKGAWFLVAAVAELKRRKLYAGDFGVHIGGRGQLLPKLRAYAVKERLTDVITFDGFIPEDEKAAYLSQADIAVFPSVGGESFGISLLEGLAAARGVVLAGDNPGYASVMSPFPEQLFNPRDVRAFAALLARWLSDASGRQAAIEKQRAYVAQFDINLVGSRLLGIYKQALQTRREA